MYFRQREIGYLGPEYSPGTKQEVHVSAVREYRIADVKTIEIALLLGT